MCEILKERGHEVFVASRSGNALEGMTAVKCDCSDPASLESLKTGGYDTVIEFPGKAKTVCDVLAGSMKHSRLQTEIYYRADT